MDRTKYSADINGSRGNYYWKVRFDFTTGGYLGISQWHEGKIERVLLCKKQTDALIKFCHPLNTKVVDKSAANKRSTARKPRPKSRKPRLRAA
jgi:hypothetical protein